MLKNLALLALVTAPLAAASYTAKPLYPQGTPGAGSRVFSRLEPADTGVRVPNVFDDPRMWGARFRELTLGAVETGIAVADFDRDGWQDIFAVSKNGPNALYRQVAPFKFYEMAHAAGVAGDEIPTSNTGATVVDINHDGFPDIYVCRYDLPNLLFVNNQGDGTFTESAKAYGLDVKDASVHAVFADYDRDGFLDLYLVTNILDFSKSPQGRKHYLFRNNGNHTFADVTAAAGIWGLSQGHTALWFDANHDGWPDLYVANDFETPDRFAEAAYLTGMAATGWTWSARFGDLDNDGRLDTFVTAGMIRNFIDADLVDKQNVAPTLAARANVWKNSAPRRESTLAYRNLGGLQFSDVSREWGLDQVGVSFGCALADLDGDGDLDLVYANYDAPPSIIRNDTVGGHRVVIKLAGAGGNPAGIGAELQLETSAGVQMRQLYTERGIVASEPALVHFGLGDETVVRKLTIRWPRGQVQELENLPADQLLTIKEPELPQGFKPAPAVFNQAPRADALLAEKAAARGLKYTVRLRPYDEFIGQRLLPRRLNGQSPALATADVNGDGHADLFVSGSTGQAGQLFLGQAGGAFAPAADQPWSTVAEADDTGAVFLDVNGDGHLDLFISAGGVQHPPGDPLFNDRLYLNDGRGRFGAAAAGALPADGESTGAAAAADFDGDGRADLFVGGRTVAGRYPETPRSFLYRNDGGKLVDVTDAVAPGLRAIGLVTAAVWSDVDGDKRPDLVVATEWGPVTVFRNNGRTLTAAPLGTDTGWWSALAVADVNGDGRPDIVAGNTGLNTKYHASASAPTELYAGDFDGSGRSHLIEAQYEGGKLVPVRGRSKLAYPFPWLTRKFPTFKAFAEASLSDIFGADKLAGVKRLTATELSSGVFLQQADGAFRFAPLPRSAQIAPVNAIVARDFDGDRHLDLLLFGNNFGPEPTTGRFDGGLGVLLKGDGKGGFAALNAAQSGVVVTGEARAAAVLPGPQGDRIVVACNQGPLLLLERK